MNKPLIVASIPINSIHDVTKIYSVGDVDFIELRVDYLDNPMIIDYTLLPRNIIITLRDINEGGAKYHNDSIKLQLIDILNKLDIMYDVEISFIKKYNISYINKILSVHIIEPHKINLRNIREDVENYMSKAFAVKIATKPFPGYKTFLVELLELGDNIAVMPMETNSIERLAFALLGSKLLYCYVDKPTAVSQPRCNDVQHLLMLLRKIV